MKRIIIIFLFVISSYSLFAQGNLIYGKKHFYTIVTPKNWIKVNHPQIPYLIFPENEGNNMTYIYSVGQDFNTNTSIQNWIKGNNEYVKSKFSGIKVNYKNVELNNIKKGNGLTGKYKIVEYIYPNKKIENILVIEAKYSIVTIVYSAINKKVFNKYYNDYEYLINSFRFLTDKIQTNE